MNTRPFQNVYPISPGLSCSSPRDDRTIFCFSSHIPQQILILTHIPPLKMSKSCSWQIIFISNSAFKIFVIPHPASRFHCHSHPSSRIPPNLRRTLCTVCTYSKNWVILSRLQLDQDHGLVSKLSDGAMRCCSLRLRVHLLLSPS